MAGKLLKLLINPEKQLFVQKSINLNIRNGHTMRGKRPGVARSLEQRLNEENVVDLELERKIDIGFPKLKAPRSIELKERLAHIKGQRNNPDLEKLARAKKLEIDVATVKSDWLKTSGPFSIKRIADHYGIYEHLFGTAYFVPRVNLNIKYKTNSEDTFNPVYYGNIIKPGEASSEPIVDFDSNFGLSEATMSKNSLWTLILTNPDGHLTENNQEYVHWFVANIPDNKISHGDCIVPYFQPFPPKGTGYHRHIFILYKQDKKLDFSDFKVNKINDLEKRTFNTLNFYRKYQSNITPAGLAFFQADYDKTVTDIYHKVLEMQEPIYEYDFPKAYIKDQKWFPLREPFNLYMDKYRDPKQVNKEYLERKLAKTNPFKGPEQPLRFPNAHSLKGMPSWLRTEKKKDRLGWGRINDI